MKSFTESQRFNQWWLWAIVIIVAIAPSYIAFSQWYKGMLDWHYPVIGVFITLLIVIGFRLVCLMTTVNEKGISYHFFPFHLLPTRIGWDEIAKVYIREYTPDEYGGRGVRYMIKRKSGGACTVGGNMGLQIILKNGKKMLLGTRHPDEMSRTLLSVLKVNDKVSVDKSDWQL